ncbi:MAG: hypothetical protein ACRELY_10025 [Polyangiaceae bacterium]
MPGASTAVANDAGVAFDGSGGSTVPPGDPPPIDPPPGPTDVVGSVYGSDGNRANTATVMLDGTVTPLDPWGRFVVRNVAPTYSLAVGAASNGIRVFDGATTRTPTVTIEVATDFSPSFASLHIAYPAPSQPDAKFQYFVYDPGGLSRQDNLVDSEIEIDSPRTSATVSIYVMEYVQDDPNAPPSQFLSWYEETNVVLTPGQTTNVNPVMSPVTSQKLVTASPTTEPGMTVYEAYFFGGPKGATQFPTLFNTWAYLNVPQTWSFDVPQIGDLQWLIAYTAYETGQPGSFGGGSSTAFEPVAVDGSSPSPALPAAPVITSPAAGSSFGIGTTITWSTEESICTLSLSQQGTGNGARLVTTARSVTLPDLSALGFTLVSGATYQAYVGCGEPALPAADADPVLGDWVGTVSSQSNVNFSLVAQ